MREFCIIFKSKIIKKYRTIIDLIYVVQYILRSVNKNFIHTFYCVFDCDIKIVQNHLYLLAAQKCILLLEIILERLDLNLQVDLCIPYKYMKYIVSNLLNICRLFLAVSANTKPSAKKEKIAANVITAPTNTRGPGYADRGLSPFPEHK